MNPALWLVEFFFTSLVGSGSGLTMLPPAVCMITVRDQLNTPAVPAFTRGWRDRSYLLIPYGKNRIQRCRVTKATRNSQHCQQPFRLFVSEGNEKGTSVLRNRFSLSVNFNTRFDVSCRVSQSVSLRVRFNVRDWSMFKSNSWQLYSLFACHQGVNSCGYTVFSLYVHLGVNSSGYILSLLDTREWTTLVILSPGVSPGSEQQQLSRVLFGLLGVQREYDESRRRATE